MIGVLALQGNFSSHVKVLGLLGHNSKLVKSPKDLDDIDGRSPRSEHNYWFLFTIIFRLTLEFSFL